MADRKISEFYFSKLYIDMNLLTDEFTFKKLKSYDDIDIQCMNCNSIFKRKKHYVQWGLKRKDVDSLLYCNRKCRAIAQKKQRINVMCGFCQTEIQIIPSILRKSKSRNFFCSKNCSAKYNNLHKSHGTRRSKLEKYIQSQLTLEFPNLEIHFNRKDAITSELDIYISSLKLAFELNGIFHYEPIYGPDKLSKIQNNDARKFQACLEHGIELCIIDTSSLKYFKEKSAKKYLDIVISIIRNKIDSTHYNQSKTGGE